MGSDTYSLCDRMHRDSVPVKRECDNPKVECPLFGGGVSRLEKMLYRQRVLLFLIV